MTGAGPMPDTAGCKTDPLLSKAEPISEAGGTSMEMRLRKGKIRCVAVLRERNEEKKIKNNSPAGIKVNEKREGGDAPSTGTRVTPEPVEKAAVRQVVPLQPLDDHTRADIHSAACASPHAEAGEQREEEGQAERDCYID